MKILFLKLVKIAQIIRKTRKIDFFFEKFKRKYDFHQSDHDKNIIKFNVKDQMMFNN